MGAHRTGAGLGLPGREDQVPIRAAERLHPGVVGRDGALPAAQLAMQRRQEARRRQRVGERVEAAGEVGEGLPGDRTR